MARTIAQIEQAIIDAKNAEAGLAGLNSTSRTAIWRLWIYVMAFVFHTLEELFDAHKTEVATIVASQKAHTTGWYVTKAKAFQYGVALPTDSDTYPTVDESALIVTQAAAKEVLVGTNFRLRLKVAKGTGTLTNLDAGEVSALETYFSRIKDAGVRLEIITGTGDTLQIGCNIYYDPLVLDNSGARLDGTATTPLQDAITSYLTDMGTNNFDGAINLNKLIDVMLAVEGITDATIVVAQSYYAATSPVPFTARYEPHDGYFVFDPSYFSTYTTWIAA